MKHIKTLTGKTLKETMKKGGCGECQTSVSYTHLDVYKRQSYG